MRRYLLIFIAIISAVQMFGQGLENLRQKTIILPADSIVVDSLSMVPNSLIIKNQNNTVLSDSTYSVNYLKSVIYPSELLNNNNNYLKISYRIFPVSLHEKIQHKKPSFNRIDPVKPEFGQKYKPPFKIDPFAGTDIVSNGDISRGIMVGNSRDPSLSSNLNLQLIGKINKDYRIEANLSDANLPIQPEGNTRQIQDFDRLYLRVYNSKNEILGGDFILNSPPGYFLRMNKKLQGAKISTEVYNGKSSKTSKIKTSLSAAVVKGKYTNNKIPGLEGNQGPYRLTGQNGETYIQIIAGSEKIYIDGILLIRGEQNDYVIDYNTAEVRFTPKNLITKDKRISAEFEYTEQSYARFLVSNSSEWEREKGNWYFNIFSEQDAKNQPLLQDLSDGHKNLLSRIGDQSSQAIVPNYFRADFRNDRVLYKITDTIASGIRYDSVLVYSIHPDSAIYQAGFSFAGSNNGDYIAVSSSANGQVYKWVAPVDGIPQGNYAPFTRLISPRSKQVLSFGGQEQLTDRMGLKIEMALSRNDHNTFSKLDDNDNVGYGFSTVVSRIDPLKPDSSLRLSSELELRRTSKSFDPLERYKPIEFERDWNLDNNIVQTNENYLKTGFSLKGTDSLLVNYRLELLNRNSAYKAIRHITRGNFEQKGWSLKWHGSQLNSSQADSETSFSRHNFQLSKKFGFIKINAGENHEGNTWKNQDHSNAGPASFRFQEWNFGLENGEQNKVPWFIRVTSRMDYLPDNDMLIKDSKALQLESGMEFKGKKGNRTSLSANWRNLETCTNEIENEEGNRSLTGRIEENFQLAGGSFVSRTFYEIGSGLERKMEFTYIKVAPGQGHYSWTDYNQNGNKELDEFEPAHFRDQADYIRIFRPGTTYIPTFQNRFNQLINFYPGRFFKQESRAFKTLSRFSNTMAFRADKKSFKTTILDQLNPFSNNLNDSLLVSENTQLRNTFSFNRNKEGFGINYHFEKNRSQILMSYGTDQRNSDINRIILRLKPLSFMWLSNLSELGEKEYTSTFFTGKNYTIVYFKNDFDISFKPGDQWQTGIRHELRRENSMGEEQITANSINANLGFQMPAKGQIRLDISYLSLNFTGNSNSPIGYVMLKGFRPGHNGLFNLSFRRKLNDLIELDLHYEGRISEGSKMIHTGNVQIRAVF